MDLKILWYHFGGTKNRNEKRYNFGIWSPFGCEILDLLSIPNSFWKKGCEDLKKSCEDLKKGCEDLKNGCDDLRSGCEDLKKGCDDLRSGCEDFKKGLWRLKKWLWQLSMLNNISFFCRVNDSGFAVTTLTGVVDHHLSLPKVWYKNCMQDHFQTSYISPLSQRHKELSNLKILSFASYKRYGSGILWDTL